MVKDLLAEVLETCSKGDLIKCVSNHCKRFTSGVVYMVHENRQGVLYVYDDNCVKSSISKARFSVAASQSQATNSTSPSTQGNARISGELGDVITHCSEFDILQCVQANSTRFTLGKVYTVLRGVATKQGVLCILDDMGAECTKSYSLFELLQPPSIKYSSSAQFEKAQPSVKSAQLAPWEESDDTPKSVVDGDYSEHDTWGIGNKPHKKVKQWEPDTIREDIDIMESIRHACNRT
jgi:hypothetical protein